MRLICLDNNIHPLLDTLGVCVCVRAFNTFMHCRFSYTSNLSRYKAYVGLYKRMFRMLKYIGVIPMWYAVGWFVLDVTVCFSYRNVYVCVHEADILLL